MLKLQLFRKKPVSTNFKIAVKVDLGKLILVVGNGIEIVTQNKSDWVTRSVSICRDFSIIYKFNLSPVFPSRN